MLRPALLLGLLAMPALAAAPKPEPALPTAKAQVAETAVALDAKDDARVVGEAYLKAVSGQGERKALDALLGGATLRAKEFRLENWKIVGREKHRSEKGQVEDLAAFVGAIDQAGRKGLATLGGGAGPGLEDVELGEMTAEDATRIVKLTRERAKAFMTTHPVFAYIARVDKPVYWHPNNPFRKLLTDAKGEYTADLDLFWVETTRGKILRKWPLRVVRFKVGAFDSGLKILPASDWNAE